jgi:hypothetical protein
MLKNPTNLFHTKKVNHLFPRACDDKDRCLIQRTLVETYVFTKHSVPSKIC